MRPGTGTDTVILGCSIHPSMCSLTGEGDHSPHAHPRPTNCRHRLNPCFRVRQEGLVPCPAPASVSKNRAPGRHPHTQPSQHFHTSASLSPFLTFLFNTLVSPFLLPIFPQVNNSTHKFLFPAAPSFASSVPKYIISDPVT